MIGHSFGRTGALLLLGVLHDATATGTGTGTGTGTITMGDSQDSTLMVIIMPGGWPCRCTCLLCPGQWPCSLVDAP